MPGDFRIPQKGDMVHYVLSNNAHRAALVTRVAKEPDAQFPLINLSVFMDGRNDTEEGTPLVWVAEIKYETGAGGVIVGAPINTWHWPDECYGHDND